MKKIFCFVLSIFFVSFLFSAGNGQNESIKAYRNALICFDNNDYGKALKYSEDAILYRRQDIEKQIDKLKTSLTSKRVQVAGDSIESVVKVLESRHENESLEIIYSFTKIKGYDYFNNSMQTLLKYMNESMVFPEAQKLIADIYKLEGEYEFAEEYYMLALKNSDVLDIPNEKYDILYTLAEISRLQNNMEKYEVRLLNILTEDKCFKDNALKSAMHQTVISDKKGSCEKFFNLYRADSYLSIDAYNQLAEYYYSMGEKEKALSFAELSAITSFSKISEIISSRNTEYSYSGLSKFFQEAAFYDDVVTWGNDSNAWRSFNILARYTNELGYKTFARELLVVLVQFTPTKYWQKDAVLQLELLD